MLLEDGVTYETAEADGVSVYSINVEILEPITGEAVWTTVWEEDATLDNLVIIFGLELNCEIESSVARELPITVSDIVEGIIDSADDTVLDTRGPVEVILDIGELSRDVLILLPIILTGWPVVTCDTVIDVNNSAVRELNSELFFDVTVNIVEEGSRVCV